MSSFSSCFTVSDSLKFYVQPSLFKEKLVYYQCSKIENIFFQVLQNTICTQHVAESVEKCEILLDLLWETINIGHWRDVDVFWRQLYRSVCFMKAVNLFSQLSLTSALKSCDMGLIMGAPVGDELFVQHFADLIHAKMSKTDPVIFKSAIQPCKAHIKPPWLPNLRIIPEYDSPSLERFIRLVTSETPFVMKNVINHWPASSKWSPEYLCSNFGSRTVPVEIGSSYTSDKWSQKLITLQKFIGDFMFKKSDEVAYLAQYDLFNHITKLKDDITLLDYSAVSEKDVVTNCWFGPEGTVSPLHHDQYQNLFCQVYGFKRFILFDRNAEMNAHPHHLLENTSQIDVECPQVSQQFPGYVERKAWSVDLGPGDVLYIPTHWWHHVRSLSISLSVSFWWKD